ncbi:hypothetical protein L6R52_24665 [Myxococcota bacterium]|nr:hypothetical protein [Myxococcota bacterium]
MSSTHGTKLLSRIRAGGVVESKARIARDVHAELGASLVGNRKLRIAGLPNRKASSLKR